MPWSYYPALDGLRSVAVYLVLLFHAGLGVVAGGFVGVDLFFVLSGFLVTNVILDEVDRTGRLSLGRFYARRVRRLLPAAVVVVTATALFTVLVFPAARRLALVEDAQSALLYFANWHFLAEQNDYFATGVQESPFLHFWSLAIEEQFYVVFPVLLVLLTWLARRWSGAVLVTLTGLCLASVGMQLFWSSRDVSWAYYGTDARLYQLMAGAVLAVALRTWAARPRPGVSTVGATLGLLGLLVLGSGILDVSPSVRGLGAALASVVLLGGLMGAGHGPVARLLSRPTLVYLGKISYGTYLWHWPVIVVLEYFLTPGAYAVALLATAISTGLASLSFEVLEHPLRVSATLRRFRWRTVVVGVATSALVAVAVVPPVLESDRRPRLAAISGVGAAAAIGVQGGISAEKRNAPVPTGIDIEELRGAAADTPLCTVDDPTACTVVTGDGPHVVLIGDSHGRMLQPAFEALAEEHDFTLSHNTVPACGWPADLELTRLNDERRELCRAQRDAWYDDVLPQMDADLVVLTQMHRGTRSPGYRGGGGLQRVGGSEETTAELMHDTVTDTVARIEATGARVLIVDSIMGTGGFDPLDCLGTATRLSQCEVPLPPRAPQSDAFYEVAAALSEDVFTVDLNAVLCVGAPQCLPVVDGIVVWSDSTHFSEPYVVHRRGRVWSAIRDTGVLRGL